jgi:hypothetical protein
MLQRRRLRTPRRGIQALGADLVLRTFGGLYVQRLENNRDCMFEPRIGMSTLSSRSHRVTTAKWTSLRACLEITENGRFPQLLAIPVRDFLVKNAIRARRRAPFC